MKTSRIELDTLFLFIVAAGVGIALAMYSGHRTVSQNRITLPAVEKPNSKSFLIPSSVASKPRTVSQISPDGTKLLSMTTTTNADFSNTYNVMASNADGSNKQMIYSGRDSVVSHGSLSIPFNTWSPDDKYVFITLASGSATQALAMRADGQPLGDASPYTNVATVFAANGPDSTYQETTGWASDNLLIINTKTPSGSKGPSYWLELPDNSLIQLSTQF